MSDQTLERMRDLVQRDIGGRGLATDPSFNLLTVCADDFRQACRNIAMTPRPVVAIVTGFFIPTAEPPAGETDGPLGALFLARALAPLGFRVVLATDVFCAKALEAGIRVAGLNDVAPLVTLPRPAQAKGMSAERYFDEFVAAGRCRDLTHLIAIERVGPSHTLESLQRQMGAEALGELYLDFLHAVPPENQDRCHTMRGRDITDSMSPAHWLFEAAAQRGVATIGIGDGGNEIGMGKVPWDVIRRNVPGGDRVACRVPADFLIVAGISNWGAYALAAGVGLLRNQVVAQLLDVQTERRLLEVMVRSGPLVDGMLGRPELSVDGIGFEDYAAVLTELYRYTT